MLIPEGEDVVQSAACCQAETPGAGLKPWAANFSSTTQDMEERREVSFREAEYRASLDSIDAVVARHQIWVAEWRVSVWMESGFYLHTHALLEIDRRAGDRTLGNPLVVEAFHATAWLQKSVTAVEVYPGVR